MRISIVFGNTSASGPGAPPVDEAVIRDLPGGADPIAGALHEYFLGPTAEEQARGLVAVRNGFAGYRRVEFADGMLSIYLGGNCQPTGNGYSIARPLIATLKQFPGVLHVRIFDAYDHTADALHNVDSWPSCLDVIFTSTPTTAPTATRTPTPSITPTSSPAPSSTPTPTATFTPPPTRTPLPTMTFTPRPTRTPLPTATASPLPTRTRPPTVTPTPRPSSTPVPTRTPLPTATASAVPTRTPLPPPSVTPLPTRTRAPTATSTPRPTLTSTLTLTPRPTSTPRPTLTPGPTNTPRPTLTLTPINAPTLAILSTAQASSTPREPGLPTPTLDVACNRAEFLGDVTIVDNATLRPGEAFRKTWRIRNAGDCPWTSAYRLVFVRGDQMGGPETVPLPGLVVSGQTADISVDLVAPGTAGQYQGFWQLQTPDGATFGIGPTATGNLWVQIRVAGQALPTPTASATAAVSTAATTTGWAEATLTAFVGTATANAALTAESPTPEVRATPIVVVDFVTFACSAEWQANDGTLECPGQDGDPRGLVALMNEAALEDGTTVSQGSLLTVPSSSPDGYILGLYPQYQVQAGDRFQSLVGCQHQAGACSVLFRLSYLDATGAAHDLWSLGEFYDGHYFDLDLDLAELAGQQVRFVLSVNNLGDSTDDRALWIAPRIVMEPAQAAPAVSTAAVSTATPSPAPTATATRTPTATPFLASPTPAAVTVTPEAPIPQFFDAVIDFFRRLFQDR